MSFVAWCVTFSPRVNQSLFRSVKYFHNHTVIKPSSSSLEQAKNVLLNNNQRHRLSAACRFLNTSNGAASRSGSNFLLVSGGPPKACPFSKLSGAGQSNVMVSKNTSLLMRNVQLRLNSNAPQKQEWAELQRMPLGKRLKTLLKKYWYVAIPMHMVVCALWFGSLFLLVKCGVDGTMIISFIQPYVLQSSFVPDFVKNIFEKDPAKLGHLAVALLLYKIVTPARYASTVFASIYTVRYLMNKGILIKSAKEIKNNYVNHATRKNLEKRIDKVRKKLTYKNKPFSNLPPIPMKPSRHKQSPKSRGV